MTISGLRATPESVAKEGPTGLIVNEADVELADVAVIWADVELVTDDVVTVKVPLV